MGKIQICDDSFESVGWQVNIKERILSIGYLRILDGLQPDTEIEDK